MASSSPYLAWGDVAAIKAPSEDVDGAGQALSEKDAPPTCDSFCVGTMTRKGVSLTVTDLLPVEI